MKYTHYYKQDQKFEEDYWGDYYHEPWLSYTDDASKDVNYNKSEEDINRRKRRFPLTFEIQSNGTLYWKATSTALTRTIEYSKNSGETWTQVTSTTGGTAISVQSGETLIWRGENDNYGSSSARNWFSGSTCQFRIGGNIMSLINPTDFIDLLKFPDGTTHNFSQIFRYATGVTDAKDLILPATALTTGCYSAMFAGDYRLTGIPELPATILAPNCYENMFGSCSSVTETVELKAQIMQKECYRSMFAGTSVTTAPELPSTSLAQACYYDMFYNCRQLVTGPSILPATTLYGDCYTQMFYTCLKLEHAPILPAPDISVFHCYALMFPNCKKLTYLKCLAETGINTASCMDWLTYASDTGTFVKHPNATWSRGTSGIPTGWTVEDAVI